MNRVPSILVTLIVAALVAFAYSGNARAQSGVGPPNQHGPPPPPPLTQSFTVELPLVGTPTGAIELPRFDPRLGTLRAASITVETRHRQLYAAEQLGLGRALFWWGDNPFKIDDAPNHSYLQIDAPSGQQVCGDLNLWPLATMQLASFDGVADFAGPSGTSTELVADRALEPVALVDLSAFIGTGSATLAVTRSGFVYHSGTTANVQGAYHRRIGATVTITYRFN